MLPQFAPQCCDATNYLELGQRCFVDGLCWDTLRPLGMTLYASLPSRLGLPPEAMILFNLALVTISGLLAARFIQTFWPSTGTAAGLMRYAIAFLPHIVFLGAPCLNSLSDAPAAALLLSGLWLTCITIAERRGPAAAGLSGLLIGLSAFMRLSYLYPVLIMGAAFVVVAAYRRSVPAIRAAAFVMALIAPLCIQVGRTHAHTGSWSYIDPGMNALLKSLHFDSVLYGYDTIVPAWKGPPPEQRRPASDLVVLTEGLAAGYDARSCFGEVSGLIPALQHADFAGAMCLVAKRQSFYFGSYASLGRVYLPSPDARHWSRWLFALNGLMFVLTLYWLVAKANRTVGVVALALLSSVWLVVTVSVPEQRFFATLSIFTWIVGSTFLWCLADRPGRSLQVTRG